MKPVVIVAGLGRCGTTLTMNMLVAGGIPGVGSAPAYEPPEIQNPTAEWLDAQAGHALKILDPHVAGVPRMSLTSAPRRVIWIDRDVRQQTRSQAKMAVAMLGVPPLNRHALLRWEASLHGDRRDARRALIAAGCTIKREFRFEQLLADPETVARKLADWLRPDFGDLDEVAMASVVIPRPPQCAPDMSLELRLIQQHRSAA